jgi:dienelactone hydrolase
MPATTLTRRRFLASSIALATAGFARPLSAAPTDVLDKLPPIQGNDELAAKMVDGLHAFLDRELAQSVWRRQTKWKTDTSSLEAYVKSVEPQRERLRQLIGAVDECVKAPRLSYVMTDSRALPIARGDGYRVYAVRWPVFVGVDGEGLLLQPDNEPLARVVAIPDADQTPEQVAGLAGGSFPAGQFARRLAENGCQVLVPSLIDRKDTWSSNARIGRMTNQPHREFLYRMAYQLGRHIIGYEVQKVLAAVDWFAQENQETKLPVGVFGYAEGGLLALHSAALDQRIDAVGVSCYFGSHEKTLSDEPIYRNVWNLLNEFGDNGVALLVLPRGLVLENAPGPQVDGPPAPRQGRGGAAPGKIIPPSGAQTVAESHRLNQVLTALKVFDKLHYSSAKAFVHPGQDESLSAFLRLLGVQADLKPAGAAPKDERKDFDPAVRQKRQFDQLVDHTQRAMRLAEERREQFFWSKTNRKSLEDWKQSVAPLRKYFAESVIGQLPDPLHGPHEVRTRRLFDEPKWLAHEVVLDVYRDVFAYGILCVPKDLKEGERRPVVVCQHGLEGRPTDVVNPKEKTKYYNSFGSALADKGYIVFAPQNPYIFQNRFRQVQRKANPLGLSLFSFIVRQHERILNWLETLPFVDPKRMAFYGLSYGGKTAMRVPAILEKYCLSICSADFNEWTWKNASVDFKGSYMFTPEYEMYEFDLGNTFGYAEMAALIAPRPFMVERGHDDGVGIDEWVAYEYAKIRRLYTKLGIPERTSIEFFNGGHEINGKGTFEFLGRHLGWPA